MGSALQEPQTDLLIWPARGLLSLAPAMWRCRDASLWPCSCSRTWTSHAQGPRLLAILRHRVLNVHAGLLSAAERLL